jgi:hypothetical protein
VGQWGEGESRGYKFFYGKRSENNQFGGRWRDIIVLNVYAPNEEKSNYSKESFYEELEQVFDHFPSTRF